MQRLFTFIVFLALTFNAQAQINEVTISSNVTLQKEAAKEQQRIQNILQQIEVDRNKTDLPEDLFIVDGACLLVGDTFEVCIDTTGITQAGASLNICGTNPFGTASFVQDTSCVIFVPNLGITQMQMDSLCIEFCDGSGTCDTTIYPLVLHRDNNTTTLPVTSLNVEESSQICPTLNLPGNFSGGQIISNNSLLGSVFSSADCIFYEAQLFAGTDTVVFEVCDNYCVCDTYLIPFNISGDTLGLPFMDDFSYDGPFPDKENWLDRNVFVNNLMALNPVSVGVATFDGLNSGGAPHGGGFGFSDALTSAYLDLSTGSDIFLSFYLEPQGLGDSPTNSDSMATLVLEFKNSLGDWVEIDDFNGYENNARIDEFTFHSYPISLSQYLYNGFQFRFRNFSRRSGNIDHWHLDYVRVLSNSSNNNPIYGDLAFTKIPASILKTYSSMPWWQFNSDELIDSISYEEINLFNHDDEILAPVLNVGEGHSITEVTTSVPITDDQLLQAGTGPNDANTNPGRQVKFSDQVANGFSTVQTGLETLFPNFTYLEFDRTFTFPLIGAEIASVPAVERNNTVTRKIIFDNYFAYDDNTAERGIEAGKKDTQIALKFHTNIADTLKAVQIHFPHIVVDASSQLFNLKVWVGELSDTAQYNGLLQKPLYIDSFTDSLNGFTTYVLTDPITGNRTPLAIPAGDFYVGWQQVSDCNIFQCIAVGSDKNRPEGMQDVYADLTGGGNWEPILDINPTLNGTLMIRAVVGSGEPQQSSNTEDLTTYSRFSIFPNPTSGQINIDITDGEHHQFSYAVFNSVGQLLQNGELVPQLDLGNLQNGIYFVKLINNKSKQIVNHKIIIAK